MDKMPLSNGNGVQPLTSADSNGSAGGPFKKIKSICCIGAGYVVSFTPQCPWTVRSARAQR